jgi:hypothetical protein
MHEEELLMSQLIGYLEGRVFDWQEFKVPTSWIFQSKLEGEHDNKGWKLQEWEVCEDTVYWEDDDWRESNECSCIQDIKE